jgi:hypothetical protein
VFDFPVTEGEREAKQREINSPIKEPCLTKVKQAETNELLFSTRAAYFEF